MMRMRKQWFICIGLGLLVGLVLLGAWQVGWFTWLELQWPLGWVTVNCGEAIEGDGTYQHKEVMAIERCAVQAFQNQQPFVARTCYVRTDSGICRTWKGTAKGQVFFARGSTGWGPTHYDEFELCPDPAVKVIDEANNIALVCPALPGPDYETFFIPWLADLD